MNKHSELAEEAAKHAEVARYAQVVPSPARQRVAISRRDLAGVLGACRLGAERGRSGGGRRGSPVFVSSLGVQFFRWIFERQVVCETVVYPIGSDEVNTYLRIVVFLILYSYTLYNGTGMVRV